MADLSTIILSYGFSLTYRIDELCHVGVSSLKTVHKLYNKTHTQQQRFCFTHVDL